MAWFMCVCVLCAHIWCVCACVCVCVCELVCVCMCVLWMGVVHGFSIHMSYIQSFHLVSQAM